MDNPINTPYIKFYSDSFGNKKFFKCGLLTCRNSQHPNTLKCAPHRVVLRKDTKFTVGWDNKASPGMSMHSLLTSHEGELSEWARNMPICTVIHLGAIDVNNKLVKDTGKAYGDYVFNFLEQMKIVAKRYLTNKEKESFEEKLREDHRFLLCGLPDWGKDYKPKYSHSLTPKQYKNARRRLNSAMKKNRKKLWREHKCVLFTPELNNPARNGIHLTPKETVNFAKQIATVCGRLCCTYCRILMSGKFDKNHHQAETLKSGGCDLS